MFTPICIIPARYAANTNTVQYTAANTRARIDKFTVTNVSANNVTLSVNLIPNGGSLSNSNLIMQTRQIAPKECYTCPELVGQYLNPGDSISTIASAASALVIRASGSEFTS